MRILAVLLLSLSVAMPVAADTQRAVMDHILPRYATFASAAQTLAQTAEDTCSVDALLPAYHTAFDAWINISHIQFGPIETRGTALALVFWPDPKDRTGKAVSRLMAEGVAAFDDPKSFQDVSVAAQGFPALERLLTERQSDELTACALRRAIATHISRTGQDLNTDWQVSYGAAFAQANVPSYQNAQETQRALYTALSTSLAILHDQRLGRPLGTFDRPRPKRAEARRSERTQRHIVLSLKALRDFAEAGFESTMTDTLRKAFDTAIDRAQALNDPSLAGVADPANRFKIEVVQRAVRDVQVLVAEQIAKPLGITAGFNALDGD